MKSRTRLLFRLYCDEAIVILEDGMGYGQFEPGSPATAVSLRREVRFEDPRQILFPDGGAVIPYRHFDIVSRFQGWKTIADGHISRDEFENAPFRRGLHRIHDDIFECLPDLFDIDHDRPQIGRERDAAL